MATTTETTTTTLSAKLQADGTIIYEVPKREGDKLLKAYALCRACANFPALKINAETASKALAFLMLDLGIETGE